MKYRLPELIKDGITDVSLKGNSGISGIPASINCREKVSLFTLLGL